MGFHANLGEGRPSEGCSSPSSSLLVLKPSQAAAAPAEAAREATPLCSWCLQNLLRFKRQIYYGLSDIL